MSRSLENNVDPTCTETGSYDNVVYCTVCGEELSRETVTVDALGHEMGEWYQTVAPTCTTEGENRRDCGRCDYYETETVDALGHTEADAVEENHIDPTCTEVGGYDMVVYCTICGEELSREHTVIAALGHTEVIDIAIDPTCTTTGFTEGKHCETCGDVLVEQTVIDALGHAYDAAITAPTCTTMGYTTYTCRCGDVYVADETDASGHVESEWIVDVEPSIGMAGSRHKECMMCGEALAVEPIEALTEAPITETEAETEAETETETEAETEAAAPKGCRSVIGMISILIWLAAGSLLFGKKGKNY